MSSTSFSDGLGWISPHFHGIVHVVFDGIVNGGVYLPPLGIKSGIVLNRHTQNLHHVYELGVGLHDYLVPFTQALKGVSLMLDLLPHVFEHGVEDLVHALDKQLQLGCRGFQRQARYIRLQAG